MSAELERQLAAERERADYAWRNIQTIEAARQEEMRKRDAAEAAAEKLRGLLVECHSSVKTDMNAYERLLVAKQKHGERETPTLAEIDALALTTPNAELGVCRPERASECGLTECRGKPECSHCAAARRDGAPSEADAHAMGAVGGPPHEGERLAFEAWMRGHCWELCATWDGKHYRSDAEQGGGLDPRAVTTRMLWAVWRDRAALARG